MNYLNYNEAAMKIRVIATVENLLKQPNTYCNGYFGALTMDGRQTSVTSNDADRFTFSGMVEVCSAVSIDATNVKTFLGEISKRIFGQTYSLGVVGEHFTAAACHLICSMALDELAIHLEETKAPTSNTTTHTGEPLPNWNLGEMEHAVQMYHNLYPDD